MAENTDALAQENDQATEVADATFEYAIEGPNGQSVQFCSLEERKLAQETAQKEREEQCKKNVLLDVNHLDVTLFTEDGALPYA